MLCKKKQLMSPIMRKSTICIFENKDANSFAVTGKLIIAFVFAIGKVQFFYFLNAKFPASSHVLCLYSSVCVRPVKKPHCWFSHVVPQILWLYLTGIQQKSSSDIFKMPLWRQLNITTLLLYMFCLGSQLFHVVTSRPMDADACHICTLKMPQTP